MGAAVALLYFGRVLFITLLVAVTIAFILEPFVEVLMRVRFPRSLASFVVCTVALAFLYVIGMGAESQLAILYQDLPKYGERIGEIAIPRLKLAVPVYEGDDEAILKRGAGHVPHTALPGQPGNVCIAAHRDKFFRALRFIKPRDEIVLDTGQGKMRFVVTSTSIVKPSDVQVLLPAPNRDLTLVTCYPFYYVGHAPKRFVVFCRAQRPLK